MKQKNIVYTVISILFVLSGLFSCVDDPEFGAGVHNAEEPTLGKVIINGMDKTASTVTLKSSVLKANGYPVTERGFLWNTDSVRPTKDDKDKWQPVGEGTGEYTDTIKNLSPGVLYYFWSYAINKEGTAYSLDYDSISTESGVGKIETYVLKEFYNASNIEYEYIPGTRATISGKINLTGEGKTVVRGVYYSESPAMENKIMVKSETSFDVDSFICKISGLKRNKKYYARTFTANEISDTTVMTLGTLADFETGDGKPVVDNIWEIEIGYSDIYVISRILHEGDTVIEARGFCWGTRSEPELEVDSVFVVNGKQPGAIVATIEDLVPEQQYFICAYAKNKYGTTYGKPLEFYVKNDIPTVLTLDPSTNYNAGKIIANGQIYNDGRSDVTVKGFCYSNTLQVPDLTNGSTVIKVPGTGKIFSEEISGLMGNTKYYMCAYAINNEGISYGEVKEVITPDALMAASDEFNGSARLSGSSAYFMIGNKGYLLGGDKGASYTNELVSYNGSTGNWLLLYPGSVAKWQSVVVHGNFAYVLGGFSTGNVLLNDFRRYNSSGNIWGDHMPGGPDPAYLRAGVTLEDTGYFIGGMGDTLKNEVWSYDFTPDIWVRKPDFPVKQYGGIALNIDGEVYAGMGKDKNEVCNKTIWKSSDGLSSWTQETDNASINGGVLAGAAYNGIIYLIDESFYIHTYDLSSKSWTKKSRINGSDQDVHGMFVIDGVIYIGLINNRMYMYNPLWDNN